MLNYANRSGVSISLRRAQGERNLSPSFGCFCFLEGHFLMLLVSRDRRTLPAGNRLENLGFKAKGANCWSSTGVTLLVLVESVFSTFRVENRFLSLF